MTELELPFFVGVIDSKNLCLNIYSGEYVPLLFTQHGVPQKELKLSPVTDVVGIKNYCRTKTDKDLNVLTAFLKMPFVMKISASDNRDTIRKKARQASDLCSRMHQNISTKVSQEYIFKLNEPGSPFIIAGSGSTTTFRRNFCFRLAEAFCNLQWLHAYRQSQFRIEEFRVYEKCYLGLIKAKIEIPDKLRKVYNLLKSELPDRNRD